MPRAAKPTRIKELEGNPDKRKLNKAEPKPLGNLTVPPIMSPITKQVWARLAVPAPLGELAACGADSLVMCPIGMTHANIAAAVVGVV